MESPFIVGFTSTDFYIPWTITQSGVSDEIKGEILLVIHPDHIKVVRYSRIFAH